MESTVMQEERRVHQRRVVRVPAVLRLSSGREMECRALDLSLGGISLAVEQDPGVGTAGLLRVAVPFPERSQAISVSVVVVQSILTDSGFRAGLRFGDLPENAREVLHEFLFR
ncbi:PilZ domain-containing protein [Aquabacterium sp. A7-Y]|uniref:PilZ domain-containing protein n=1 Tax=Aquabacterium sp. A7-Y TaxID=1349605 RepID=UPI00223D4AA6|nr:PilZ domain-containing protein [Aquabacterium sp. A7-Y]MCW7536691.1 PilZ domain-containing protein [Aquabacterium sp. A7-Y]